MNNAKDMFNPENATYEKLISGVLDDIGNGLFHSELDEITDGKDREQLWKEFYFQTETVGESSGGAICQHILNCIDNLKSQ